MKTFLIVLFITLSLTLGKYSHKNNLQGNTYKYNADKKDQAASFVSPVLPYTPMRPVAPGYSYANVRPYAVPGYSYANVGYRVQPYAVPGLYNYPTMYRPYSMYSPMMYNVPRPYPGGYNVPYYPNVPLNIVPSFRRHERRGRRTHPTQPDRPVGPVSPTEPTNGVVTPTA